MLTLCEIMEMERVCATAAKTPVAPLSPIQKREDTELSDERAGMPVDRRGLSDEMREMLDQSERNYEGWNPEDRPQLIGTVADITPDCDCGGFGTHNILFVDMPDGNGVAVHVFHSTLRSQIDAKIKQGRLGVGDLIAISHLGTKPSTVKGHADMNMYRVVVRQKPPAVRYTPDGDEYR